MQIIAWMPQPPQIALFVNPNQQSALVVGAVLVKQGLRTDREIYFSLLSDRLNLMLDKEEDPVQALRSLYEALEANGLAPESMPTLAEAGNSLVFQNDAMREHLDRLGIPGDLPARMNENSPRAARLIERTTLEAWTSALLEKPIEADRANGPI